MLGPVLPWVFLIGFSVVLAVMLLTVAFHVWWHMPYIPTPHTVVDSMIRMARLKPGETVYDLGAGDGRLLRSALAACPGIHAVGFEGAIGVWLLARLRAWRNKNDIAIERRDFMRENLSDADVIFTYLSPAFMDRLAPKFAAELKSGTRIISHAFKFRDREAEEMETLSVPVWGRARVYKYVW